MLHIYQSLWSSRDVDYQMIQMKFKKFKTEEIFLLFHSLNLIYLSQNLCNFRSDFA